MAQFSYTQTDFRGGIWSPNAQGRTDDKSWKTAMQFCLNGWPTEEGAWTRRPGFRYIQHTRQGQKARLLPFRFSRDQAYQAELTPLKLRFFVGLDLLKDEVSGAINVTNITSPPGYDNAYGVSYGGDYGYGLGYGLGYSEAVSTAAVAGLPSTWANGDTVMFDISTVPPSTLDIFGRQFEIANLDASAQTFQLVSPITGLPVLGINFIARSTFDTVKRILEFNTPYSIDDLLNVRIVQAVDSVLFLCPGHKPQALLQNGASQFTFGEAPFIDGPYFDVNTTVTTLTPGGTTGNITLTASETAGINNGDGFVSTDVGRLIRFQCSPPVWDSGTVYFNNEKVLGSDGNVYRSVKGNNVAHDPLTDDGTWWEIAPDQVLWTWFKVTSVEDNKHIHVDVKGDDLKLPSSSGIFSHTANTLTPTKYWRMGVYTDTPDLQTGRSTYPTCGTYHQGRLCLAGAKPNRVDTTKSLAQDSAGNTILDFGPTYKDGTVADDNGLSFVLNSRDAQEIEWMLSTQDGLAIGTLAGEWAVVASQLNDPITPFDIQATQVTDFGAKNVEPIRAHGSPVWIQARERKVLTNKKVFTGIGYVAGVANLSIFAENLMSPGIAELAWMQEPALSLFARKTDDTLIGCSYKNSYVEEPYNGWHEHEHGLGRVFEGLSYGPNFQGTGDAIFVVTANPNDDDPVSNPRWVETIMPVASKSENDWVAWHTDGSSTAWFIRRQIIANGDSFDGITVYGLDHLEDLTIHPWIGGLDLGDFVVDGGRVDIPYSGKFTAGFIASLSDGTDYGDWGQHLRWADVALTTNPQFPLNTLLVIDNTTSGVIPTSGSSFTFLWDWRNDKAYRYQQIGSSNGAPGSCRVFDSLSGNLVIEANRDHIFGSSIGGSIAVPSTDTSAWSFGLDAGPAWQVSGSGTYLFGPINTIAPFTYGAVDTSTLKLYGFIDSGFLDAPAQSIPVHFEGIDALGAPQITDFAVIIGLEGATKSNRITAADLSPLYLGPNGYAFQFTTGPELLADSFDETWDTAETGLLGDAVTTFVYHDVEFYIRGCRGCSEQFGYSDFFLWGADDGPGSETRWNFYRFFTYGPGTGRFHTPPFGTRQWDYKFFGSLKPNQIDPHWLTVARISFAPDPADGNLFGLATMNTGDGQQAATDYILKISTVTGEVLWSKPTPTAIPAEAHFGVDTKLANGWWFYFTGNITNPIYGFNTVTGAALPSIIGQLAGFSGYAGHSGTQIFDGVGPSFVVFSDFNEQGGNVPTYIGDYANANKPTWPVQEWNRVWLGLSYTQDQDHRSMEGNLQFIPVNFGVSFTSRGQLLPPDFGDDAGMRAGPASGKIRRSHWWYGKFVDSYNVSVGTDFLKMLPVQFVNDDSVATVPPNRFTGMRTSTLQDNYSKEGAICWEVTRQYPCTITSLGGYLAGQDK